MKAYDFFANEIVVRFVVFEDYAVGVTKQADETESGQVEWSLFEQDANGDFQVTKSGDMKDIMYEFGRAVAHATTIYDLY